ncbi:hypothetical protein HYU21_04060 [Candidatus Woesearchaeota archaeon]|nr:hypothetical protein [Candidatus Woesearchaeota archaeon]
MKILLTAQQRGSTNTIAPVARELSKRGHSLTIYATGNETEAAGFQGLSYEHIHPANEDYSNLVKNYSAVIVGVSGYGSPDYLFLKAANSQSIPTITIENQNNRYRQKFGTNIVDLPTLLAVMSEDCIQKLKEELGQEMGEEAAKRSRVVGWTAFDNYSKIRDDFNEENRVKLLHELGLNSEELLYTHFTQNTHPLSKYITEKNLSFDEWTARFNYEMGVTRFTFEAASDLGLKLFVKPHPGEEFERNYTKELAERYGFAFIPAKACNTQQLMLASYSITAGRSTSLTEATLLDRNAAGIIPDLGEEWVSLFPPLELGAIPYTQNWQGIKSILKQVTSQDKSVVNKLAEDRKKFSVDGKASKRLADLVEGLR